MLARTDGLQTPFQSQFLLNEIGEPVILNEVCRQVLSSFDQAYTHRTPAVALKCLVHVPFRGWVKERKLLTFLNGFQGKE